ncbi:MAG: ATP-binding protein [Thermodesulfobacteriota bacterium]
MLGLRQKLTLGFGGLLAIVLIVGFESIMLLTELGGSIDLILRENYRSVIACQQMKEALERIDSGLLFRLLGYDQQGQALIDENLRAFRRALEIELHNITLPGEGEKAGQLQSLFEKYKASVVGGAAVSSEEQTRREAYFSEILPLFHQIKATADDILTMNQENMREASQHARRTAAKARGRMFALLVAGGLLAIGFMVMIRKWILRPIAMLICSANEIRSGNLDLMIQVDSKDEIGELSRSFDAMAESLRGSRRIDRARLLRIQNATEQAFRYLPDGIAIVDTSGNIELINTVAADAFGMKENRNLLELPFSGLVELFHEALRSHRVAESRGGQGLIQRFVRGEERFYRPRAIPILDSEEHPAGVMLLLSDATREREQNELKRGVISTVAHQLRNPLTSVRMVLHLLLEEKVGRLTEKQADLLVAAREDSERLHSILEQLLNMSRIESGKAHSGRRVVSSYELVLEALEPFRRPAHERGIAIQADLPDDLPGVVADTLLINQAFANLLSNALKYTHPGGRVTVSARAEEKFVVFGVSDTGKGIPEQYLRKVLDQFFRVPGQSVDTGIGLGLSIVQEIVAAHGGSVNVESTEGKGSSFTFSIPIADAKTREESGT